MKTKRIKKLKSGAAAFVLLLLVALPLHRLSATQVYQNYTYDYWGNPVKAPASYIPSRFYLAGDMGTSQMKQPQDMFYQETTEKLYIADTGNNRILVLDNQLQVATIIDALRLNPDTLGLDDAGKRDSTLVSAQFSSPNGLFVDRQGLIYVADTDNRRVVVIRENGEVVRLISRPQGDVNFTGIDFLPMKVLVDQSGYIYLLCKGIYHGAIVYSPENRFSGYFGANTTEVTLSVVVDSFWRRLYTAEQRQKMDKYVPIEFSNFDIDEHGFIYTTTLISTTYQNHIKKFNHSSVNVLPGNQVISAHLRGFYGDLSRVWYNSQMHETRFTDISYSNGFIYALDISRGRVFEYDRDGMLVSVFAGLGSQQGTFNSPVAVETIGDDVLVLDAGKNSISVFKPTAYCDKVHTAIKAYNEGQYTDSLSQWMSLLADNSNFQLAYIGIGKAYFETEEYEKAMAFFQKGQDREGYSKAFQQLRNNQLKAALPALVLIASGLLILVSLMKHIKRKRRKAGYDSFKEKRQSRLAWVWYTMKHPVKGFLDCKENHRYSSSFAVFLALMLFVTTIAKRQITGFPFNYDDPERINILMIFAGTTLLLIFWSVCNWAVSTLMEGEGRMNEIFYVSAVSLTPYLLGMALTLVLSNYLVASEGMFLTWISGFGTVWSMLMLFIGLLVLHDYSFIKTIKSIALTLFLLAVGAFITILFFSLFQQTTSFVEDVYNEINFRLLRA